MGGCGIGIFAPYQTTSHTGSLTICVYRSLVFAVFGNLKLYVNALYKVDLL